MGKVHKRYEKDYEISKYSDASLPRLKSCDNTSSCPSLLMNLASNGMAYSNNNPIEAVKKIIKHQKPNITEACIPDEIHHLNCKWNHRHAKKLVVIEDIMQDK